jgi:hypothetical protein
MELVSAMPPSGPSCQTLVGLQCDEDLAKRCESYPPSPDEVMWKQKRASSTNEPEIKATSDDSRELGEENHILAVEVPFQGGIDIERQLTHTSEMFSKSRKYTLLAAFSCAQFLGGRRGEHAGYDATLIFHLEQISSAFPEP